MIIKKNFIATLICLGFGIGACGQSSDSVLSEPTSSSNAANAVVGPCTLVGNIRSFEISCDRDIKNFFR